LLLDRLAKWKKKNEKEEEKKSVRLDDYCEILKRRFLFPFPQFFSLSRISWWVDIGTLTRLSPVWRGSGC
jgi:hypothetical protein